MEKGTVYFFTGLAGAGKTTVGGLFYRRLKARKTNVFCMDGDAMDGVFERTGYSTAARLKDAKAQFRLCRALSEQGIDVVMCSISMYDEIRDWNRANIDNYREIYIKVTPDTLYRRDQKKLYSSGAKEVVGWTCPGTSRRHLTPWWKTTARRRRRPLWSGWKSSSGWPEEGLRCRAH